MKLYTGDENHFTQPALHCSTWQQEKSLPVWPQQVLPVAGYVHHPDMPLLKMFLDMFSQLCCHGMLCIFSLSSVNTYLGTSGAACAVVALHLLLPLTECLRLRPPLGSQAGFPVEPFGNTLTLLVDIPVAKISYYGREDVAGMDDTCPKHSCSSNRFQLPLSPGDILASTTYFHEELHSGGAAFSCLS